MMEELLTKTAKRFALIAIHLKREQLTINELADEVHLSPSVVKSTIIRSEETCGESLVLAKSQSDRALMLTNAGYAFLDRITEFAKPISDQKNQRCFTISISQTMLTSGLLDGVFATMRNRAEAPLNLRTKTRMLFTEVVEGIRKEEIDFSIVWGVPQRLRQIPKDFTTETIAPLVDVVVVAREKFIIDLINPAAHWFKPDSAEPQPKQVLVSAMENLRKFSCAILPGDSQAAIDLIPKPDQNSSGQFVEVDTIDAAISFVRCGAVDYCVVPAIYDCLEKEQQEGKFVFSEPIAQIPLVVIARKTLDARGKMILSHLLHSLKQDKSLASWRKRRIPTDSFPRSYSFYTKLKYGYYIGADPKSTEEPLQWCWQSIKLVTTSKNRRGTLEGCIVNQFGSRFKIITAQFRDNFLIARVKPVGRNRHAAKEFLSRFHYCDYKSGVICGTWSGNSRDNRPGVFATVWSHEKLCRTELSKLTRFANLHCVMDTRTGCDQEEGQLDLVDHLGDLISVRGDGDDE